MRMVESRVALTLTAGWLMTAGIQDRNSGLLTFRAIPTVHAETCPVTVSDEWDGGGSDKKWTTGANWVDNSAPTTNEVCLHLPSLGGHQSCDFDRNGLVGTVTIFGASPTVFGFNVINDPFIPPILNLWGYTLLDIDDCTEVEGETVLRGGNELNVASGITCCLGTITVDSQYTVLKIIGVVDGGLMEINAQQDIGQRGLTVKGGGTLDVNRIEMLSEIVTTEPTDLAGLVLEDGNITTNALQMIGGQTESRRVWVDLEQNMTVKNATNLGFTEPVYQPGGVVVINVDPGKVLDLGELHLYPPGILKVTGTDTTSTPGQVKSSVSEEAADETCSCP